MKATIENIKEVLIEAEVLADLEGIKTDIPLSEQGIDSLDLANVYLLLEEQFEVKVTEGDLIKLDTIDNIITYINT